ncbi:putative inactive poly [ADP-ribose] polymerase SRO1 [Platanthera zijinensis]|uniref:Inactive poly [ADP-ribose] polymerase SRO1 n=1 Tax=Platanthera zijinensis TaxID=2320716 RepID=A0AAP0B1Y2_9ASPA
MEGSNRVLSPPNVAAAAAADNLSSSGFTSTAVNSISNLSSGFFPADKVSPAYRKFKQSAAPSRFLLFSQNAWADLDRRVVDQLLEGFLIGKTALEASVDGKPYLFDFLSMSRTDPSTGRQNSLAWIDVRGRCFFPADERANPGLRLNASFPNPPRQRNPRLAEERCDEIIVEVSSDRWPETKSLRDDEKLYKTVEKLFLSSIKRFSPGTTITSIHRCLHSAPSGNSRLLTFELQKRAAMEARGNANVKFGWHGTSSSSIATIISQGFGKTNSGQLGLSSHGLGIHLSPPHSPYASALLSEADEDGERHVMLCRIIMGNSEKVEAGSSQDHPSNEGFDSGIDDPVNPKWYVVWNTNMNTHIIPEYVVSFKSSSHSSGQRKSMGARKLSNRPLCRLFTEIGMRLPSSKMQALEILYNQYRVGKFSKEVFIRYMRSVAGDQLLTSSINKLRVC